MKEQHKQPWSERFDKQFADATDLRGYLIRPEIVNDLKSFISSLLSEERERVVEDYTNWLIKHSYVDSDIYTEEPKAVDSYLEEIKD